MVTGFDMNCNKMSAFSALHLLRSYNHLFLPDGFGYGAAVLPALVQCANPALSIGACRRERTRDTPTTLLTTPSWTEDRHRIFSNVSPTSEHQPFGFRPPLGDERSPETPEDTFLPYEARRLLDPRGHAFGSEEAESRLGGGGATHSQCGGLGGRTMRPRGEKRPIPEEQKDERYFERRKRNNQAAKKSRDARKIREDQIALRATMLEHENAMLRSQLLTLREEATSLRQMLLLSTKTTISRDQNPVLSTTAPSGGQIQTIPT